MGGGVGWTPAGVPLVLPSSAYNLQGMLQDGAEEDFEGLVKGGWSFVRSSGLGLGSFQGSVDAPE